MADLDGVIAGIERALAADPANSALRLHLAELLLGQSRHGEALAHCAHVLTAHPGHAEAMALAARAAGVAPAPGTGPAAPAPAEPAEPAEAGPRHEPVRAGAEASATSEELDRFLEEVLGPTAERPSITLADVAGLDHVKQRLHASFLGPLANPELRRMYGKSLRGGLLLYGPPGCGKTYLARAVAGEMGARFFPVGLHEVLDMWLGQSERNVHEIFEVARRNAPCVLFFDEVDAIGQKRSLARQSASRGVIAQLLAELDGVDTDNDGVFVLAATNAPWDVDPALRRPGRFDRTLLVLPPDEPARAAILALHLTGRPVEPGVDLGRLAAKADRYSGADLRLVCEAAAEAALADSLATGRARPITTQDLARALRDVRPSTGEWFDIARNFVEFANEGGLYDEVLAYMKRHRL